MDRVGSSGDEVLATARNLSPALVAIALVWALAAYPLIDRPAAVLWTTAATAAWLVTAYGLVCRRHPALAASVLVAGLWIGTTWAVATSGTVAAGVLSTYLIAILAAHLLIGGGAALATAAVTALACLGLAYLETRGLLFPAVEHTPWSAVAVELLLVVVATLMLRDALGRLRDAQARAEEREARIWELIDHASDGIVVLDRDGSLLEANTRFADMVGCSREELLGSKRQDFLEGDDLDPPGRSLRGLAPGELVIRERSLRRGDGTLLPVEDSASAYYDGRILVIVRDVSERSRAEQTRDQLRTALEEADEAIALFDADWRLVSVNRAFRRIHGDSNPLRPGMHIDELADLPRRRELMSRAIPAVTAGRRWSGRHDFMSDDDVRFVYHVTMSPVHDETGGLGGYVGILRDITREVELEESLNLAEKMEAVGKLAGGLAHDFNNLLTVILGAAEMIREATPSEDVDDLIDATLRAAALTTKLLGLSHNRTVVRRRLNLNLIVHEVSGMLRRLVREDISFRVHELPEPLWIEADPSQIHQILVNLVTNARDAIPKGGAVEVSTAVLQVSPEARPPSVRLPDGAYAVLSVRDSGEGMSEEVLERLFEPFFTTKQPGRGTGIGLASVHKIVQQLAGAIHVESQVGKGSSFTVYFPQVSAPRITGEEAGAIAARPASDGVRLIVVEDDPLVRAMVGRVLESRGHRVVTARTGTEAVSLALVDPPDLLVTDVILPELSGSKLAERLREEQPQLPVLFISGYMPDDAIPFLTEDERTRFLAKPFTVEEFVSHVTRLLERREPPTE